MRGLANYRRFLFQSKAVVRAALQQAATIASQVQMRTLRLRRLEVVRVVIRQAGTTVLPATMQSMLFRKWAAAQADILRVVIIA